jgi:chromosome segregation protein
MYLKNIELSGFKSFARKTSLDFKTPITTIVGPNGSGKSNIAEAFRFVLGEQSVKSLRGGRGEDLIFNGSQNMSKMNRALVKIVFDNSSKFLDIDYDEVLIERIVHRDGLGEYRINGSTVRLKDLNTILAKAHIGMSGHHIISQGQADRILDVDSKERKKMIEDALGLRLYQIRKKESERKLQKTRENMNEVNLLRRELVPHLKFLSRQVAKIEKTFEMRKELVSLYKEYFKREETYIESTKKQIKSQRGPVDERLAVLEKSLKEVKEVVEAEKQETQKLKEIVELENRIKTVREEKNNLTRNIGRIEGEINAEKNLVRREMNKDREDQLISLSKVKSLKEEVDFHIENILVEESISKIKETLKTVKTLFNSFISKNENVSSIEDAIIKESKERVSSLEQEFKENTQKLLETEESEKSLMEEYKILNENIEEEKDSYREAEKKVLQIIAEQNELRGKLGGIESIENSLDRTIDDFKREIDEARVLAGDEALKYMDFAIEKQNENRELQENRRKKIEKIKIRLEDSGIVSSDEIMKEYQETKERDEFLEKETEDMTKSAESLESLIKELEEKVDEEFKEGIVKINQEFNKFFLLIFGGGEASVSVVKIKQRIRKDEEIIEEGELDKEGVEEDSVEEGVEIKVKLPNKKLKGLVALSGGERALTSLALIFAMSQVNPPPFIILDETDAALDEANSRKYGDMIEELSKTSQLIFITHNRETMSRAGVLYGITMGNDGVSKVLSVDFSEAIKVSQS